MTLGGCGTALVTPFRSDGSLDEEALSKLVEWQIASGIHFLVACGTTGETPTLSNEEWLRVIGIVTETSAGRVPVLAGCTHNSTAEAVARGREAASVPGVSGLLTANPFYNKPGQEGQYRHFRAIAEAVECPVVLYNIPSRTGRQPGAGDGSAFGEGCAEYSGSERVQWQSAADRRVDSFAAAEGCGYIRR